MTTFVAVLFNVYVLGALAAWVVYWLTGRWRSMPPGFDRRLSILGYMLMWPVRLIRFGQRLVGTPTSGTAPGRPSPVSPTGEELARIGLEAYGGVGGVFRGLDPALLDPPVQQAFETIGYRTGTPAHKELTERLLRDLRIEGAKSPPWGPVGAFLVAWNYGSDDEHGRPDYWAIAENGLIAMREQNVPAHVVPPFMVALWHRLHPEQPW